MSRLVDSDIQHRHFVSNRPGLWRSAQVRHYLGGVSAMWIVRRLKSDPTFPKPTKIGERNFWEATIIIEWWEQQKVREVAS
jgi:predicted DNA-binding transcriptional regulator AlpA